MTFDEWWDNETANVGRKSLGRGGMFYNFAKRAWEALEAENARMLAREALTCKAHNGVEKEIANLREELAAEREKVRGLEVTKCTSPWPDSPPCRGIASVQAELAAAHATIAEMRGALEALLAHYEKPAGITTATVMDNKQFGEFLKAVSEKSNSAAERARAALALPTNQDALDEALASECERLADTVLTAAKVNGAQAQYDIEASDWLRGEAAVHRARKEGK